MPERAENLQIRRMKMKNDAVVTIIGAGLAGSEAANICARAGVHVKLYEMKPVKCRERSLLLPLQWSGL